MITQEHIYIFLYTHPYYIYLYIVKFVEFSLEFSCGSFFKYYKLYLLARVHLAIFRDLENIQNWVNNMLLP